MLSKVARIIIQFSPTSESSRVARELYSRVGAAKARKSNPECVVEAKLRLAGDPLVFVEYSNKTRETIRAKGLNALEIIRKIREHSQEADTKEMLNKAGLEGTQLQSNWGSAQEHNPGTTQKVPIA